MRGVRITNLIALSLLACATALGATDDKIDAFIMGRPKANVTVILTDETKTKDNKGLFDLRKEYMANTVLIPGIKVELEGVSDNQGRVVATTITVDGDDLETAEMIQSGLHPTAEQVGTSTEDIQQLTDRFSQLSDYDMKAARF